MFKYLVILYNYIMAAYPKPNNNTGIFNNQSFVNPDTGGLTVDEAKKYFITFPNTQSPSTIIANNFNTTGSLNVAGDSQFGGDVTFIGGVSITGVITFEDDVEVAGTTTLDDNLLCLSTATIDGLLTAETGIDISVSGGLTFPDNTTQTTAYDDTNTVQNNQNNTFLSPYIQTFQGSNSTTSSTGPLQISNITTSEYASFFIDPSPTYDLTLYTAQTGSYAGLTVRNPSYSFSVNPTVGNVASFVNPIASTYSISGQSFGVNTNGNNAYTIYSNTAPINYGLVIANTTGNNASLTLSNNGSIFTTLTSSSTGLYIDDPLSVNGGVSCTSLSTTGNLNVSGVVNVDVINGKTVPQPSLNTAPSYPDNTNKIATTSYVTSAITAVAPVYTQSTLSMDPTYSQYFSLTPVTIKTTYTSGNNIVTFNNQNFTITTISTPFAVVLYLNFSITPFPYYPPPSSLPLTLFCSNGVNYSATLTFQSGDTLQIVVNGAPKTVGLTFTGNLTSLGQFTP
jgi:cytoskeletal protein CcmA (bactofilin family)